MGGEEQNTGKHVFLFSERQLKMHCFQKMLMLLNVIYIHVCRGSAVYYRQQRISQGRHSLRCHYQHFF